MRRFVGMASVLVVALAVVSCTKKADLVVANSTDDVTVTVLCMGDSVVARIKPYVVTLPNRQGNTKDARWVLSNESTVDSVLIGPKTEGGPWPFGGNLPYKSKKGNPGKGNGVISQSPGTYPYSYAITAFCTFNAKSYPIVIDPDMIIIWN